MAHMRRSIPSFRRLPSISSIPHRRPSSSMIPLTLSSLNPTVKNVEYAVRGELAIKAEEYRLKLQEPNHGLPFDKVISSNIGNPQQKGLDQTPITFTRQVAALTEYPALADLAPGIFPADVVARAQELLEEIGSVGAYSHSQGVPLIRKNVAKFIEERDGFPSDPNSIFLTAGASSGVSLLLSMLLTPPDSGVLIPIPQYPLYTATLAQFSGKPIPYYLDETKGWSTSVESVQEAITKAKSEGTDPKVLVVINPGNPTGSVLDADTQTALVRLCERHGLVLLADEVYQSNLHNPTAFPFTSFKKTAAQLNSPIPLVSFHSISKGVSGECGRRGGYFECHNFPSSVLAEIYKMVSVGLCPPLQGQIGVDCMIRPPRRGEESFELWHQETSSIHTALATRTKLMADRLNQLPGISCVSSPGALYLHPKVTLSSKAIDAAKQANKTPDVFYTLRLLDETGICATPGSGFGQKDGEWHFRLTCLCPGVEEYVESLERFHLGWVKQYGVE